MDVVRVGVVGAGSWGTTIASLTATNAPTLLWCRSPEVADDINIRHCNGRYLPGLPLHPELRASTALADVALHGDVLVMAVPSQWFRATLTELVPFLRPGVPIVNLAKGLEQGTRLRMTQVAAEVAPGHPAGVLTGPNLSKEILSAHAAAAVLAMDDGGLADRLQCLFTTEFFRVYTNDDVTGCEIAGAAKNVIAIAAGIAAGLGIGDNALAALITRGLSELTRLGVAVGGSPATFAGLAGMGDLVATCISTQSRNRHVGVELGRGRNIEDILAEMDQVAEGVSAVPVVKELADEHGVDMPIVAQMYAILVEGRPVVDSYRGLLSRKAGREVHHA
jgi:glycerol-3-phosphate dehydrogenase (NAD(P)+)